MPNRIKFSEVCYFGFTLVELMVVVAIIGILSAVAVPTFKRYKYRAMQTEAKIKLASVRVGEDAFFGEYNVYATCLGSMGVDIQGGYYGMSQFADFIEYSAPPGPQASAQMARDQGANCPDPGADGPGNPALRTIGMHAFPITKTAANCPSPAVFTADSINYGYGGVGKNYFYYQLFGYTTPCPTGIPNYNQPGLYFYLERNNGAWKIVGPLIHEPNGVKIQY